MMYLVLSIDHGTLYAFDPVLATGSCRDRRINVNPKGFAAIEHLAVQIDKDIWWRG